MACHRTEISHEFPAGASGPARSYWNVVHVTDDGYELKVGMVMQPPTAGKTEWGHLDMPQLVTMLDEAFERGRSHKAAEIRRVLAG